MPFFKNQIWHLLFYLVSIPVLAWLISGIDFNDGSYLGLITNQWFWIAIAVPIAHQIFVWLSWRGQLNFKIYDKFFGKSGFVVYAVIFQILFVGRLIVLIGLALSNQNSPEVNSNVAFTVGIIFLFPVLLTFYSVIRYFGFKRAMGADHFDPKYRDMPMVDKGMFRVSSNSMYTFASLAALLPGLFLFSISAIIAGSWHYIALWVHYFCTEKPDMHFLYGSGKGKPEFKDAPS